MAFNSQFYEIEIKDADDAYLKPKADWDRLANIFSLTTGNMANTLLGNNVVTGLGGSYIGQTVTIASGKAFATGVFMESTGGTNIVISTTNATYKIYMSPLDKKLGTFALAATTGAVPSTSTYLYDAVVSGGAITSIVDQRTYVPTAANHNHTGGAQGPQITDAGISATAAIAYSKLALTGSIVNADISATAAIAYSKLSLTTSIVNNDINASAAIAYSKLNLASTIVNADVSGTAAIAYSKLNLATSIVNADVSATAAIAYSKLNLVGLIVNADINGSAAIAGSKLNLTSYITNSHVAAGAAIAYSKLALGTSIVNADVSTSAAIAYSKLNLSAAIVYADLANNACKAEIFNAADISQAANVNKIRFYDAFSVSVTLGKLDLKMIRVTTDDSSAATTPGSVTRKLPVYDSNNNLLGYLAIYGSIT
ncbi:MAG: hypothetical protein AABY07_10825 [Nanoarchaeota archaeon]